MKNILYCALLGLLLHTLPASAAPQQNHAEISAAIEDFVRSQTLAMPGKIDIKVGEVDRRIRVPACPDLETFIPPGGKLLGNSTVGVRCTGINKWTLFVPVQVKLSATLLILNKPLGQGQTLRAEDITSQLSEITQAAMLTDPSEAIGKVLKVSLGAGQILKREMLRAPYAMKEGQAVQLQVEGDGYTIRADGQALSNVAEGDAVRVKTSSGQVVNGLARAEGIVEVRP